MLELALLVLGCFVALAFTIVFVAVAFFKKKRKLYYLAAASFIVCIGLSVFAVGTATVKTFNRVSRIITPRTGQEIYEALFGEPNLGCASILHYTDQVIPKIDYAIWLHFKTCPEEIDRIIARLPYSTDTTSQAWFNDGPSANNNWFKPNLLGDTLIVYHYKLDEYGNGQTIYTNLNRTEAYCIDILD